LTLTKWQHKETVDATTTQKNIRRTERTSQQARQHPRIKGSNTRFLQVFHRQYRDDLGALMVGQLDVLEVAEYLDQFSNNAYTKHRGLLVQIFTFAVAKGYYPARQKKRMNMA
jgi:hypothetical protein